MHSFCWNTYNLSKSEQLRAEYHGSTCADPITGKPAVYYPSWKRRLWYMFSVVSMLPLLVLGVAIMTLSLNLNGYVKNTESPIYIEWLAAYAQPGGLFAGDSPYFLWLVPTLAHSIVVSAINQLYSTVAEKCTNLENHRTVHRWHSSLVIKRVFFECFDCFMPLFYIAFYQLDVITLRAEIVSLFMSDEIRRVFVETVVPFVKDLCVSGVRKKKGRESVPDLLLNAEYDTFDDYLEMVIQFGYITLFASAFPLGSAVTLLFLYVEIRSDLFKLLHVYRRPMPRRARDIGVWFDVMRVMVFVAILTNCAILGFSSEQLMQWTPSLFSRDLSGGGDQVMAMGSGRYVVGVVFGFEHLLLVIAVWLQCVIKPEPKWVRVAIARREYLAKEKAKKH